MKQPCRLWVLITPIYHLLLSTCTWRAHSCLSGGDLNVRCSYQLHPAEGGSTWWTGPTVGPEQEVHVAAGLDCRAQSAHVRLWAHLRGFVETKAAFIRVFPLLAVTHSTTGQRASVGPGHILSFSGRFLSEVTLKSWLSAKNGASELPLLPVLLAEDSGEWNHVKTNQRTFK